METLTIYDKLGLIGVIITLLAYFFLQTGKVSLRGWLYSFLNALGSLLIIVSLLKKFNISSFIMEVIWLVLSIYGFYKIHQDAKKKHAHIAAALDAYEKKE